MPHWSSLLKTKTKKQTNKEIFIRARYMCVGITAEPFSGFCHIHLLGYPLSQHTQFQKLPVCFVS